MPIRVKCDCGRTLTLKDAAAGKSLPCPACGHRVQVPVPDFLDQLGIEVGDPEEPPGPAPEPTGPTPSRYRADDPEPPGPTPVALPPSPRRVRPWPLVVVAVSLAGLAARFWSRDEPPPPRPVAIVRPTPEPELAPEPEPEPDPELLATSEAIRAMMAAVKAETGAEGASVDELARVVRDDGKTLRFGLVHSLPDGRYWSVRLPDGEVERGEMAFRWWAGDAEWLAYRYAEDNFRDAPVTVVDARRTGPRSLVATVTRDDTGDAWTLESRPDTGTHFAPILPEPLSSANHPEIPRRFGTMLRDYSGGLHEGDPVTVLEVPSRVAARTWRVYDRDARTRVVFGFDPDGRYVRLGSPSR